MAQEVFCSGRWGSIVFALRRDGSSPAAAFLDGLKPSDQAKMIALLKRAADMGWMNINNREKFKKIADGWFEFKCHQIRMLCYHIGHDLILTHGFIKEEGRFPCERDQTRRAHQDRTHSEQRSDESRPK